MAKFKVGDKVRVKKDLVVDHMYGCEHFVSNMCCMLGETVTIEQVDPISCQYRIKEHGYWWTDEMLEDSIVFTKADLKDGMVVENKGGHRRLVIGNKLMGKYDFINFANYNDDLKHITHPEFTIDAVYNTKANVLNSVFDDHNLEVIWTRPCEIEYVETTVEEIEKALGCKIKVVGSEGK